jgi:3-oxoadipate enol-lactonase
MAHKDLPVHKVWGQGSSTVFLLHGMYGAKEYWRPQAERLVSLGYRVIAWDAPGYGTSPLPAAYSLDALADDAAELIKAVGTHTNVVMGQSMGGQLVFRIFARIPEVIGAAVVCATIGYFGNKTPEERAQFVREREEAAKITDPSARKALVDQMLAPGAHGPDVDLVREITATTPRETTAAAVAAVQAADENDSIAAIKGVSVRRKRSGADHRRSARQRRQSRGNEARGRHDAERDLRRDQWIGTLSVGRKSGRIQRAPHTVSCTSRSREGINAPRRPAPVREAPSR